MAVRIEEKPTYRVIIKDPKGEVIHDKKISADQIDKSNFTKVHKLKAVLNILSKPGGI